MYEDEDEWTYSAPKPRPTAKDDDEWTYSAAPSGAYNPINDPSIPSEVKTGSRRKVLADYAKLHGKISQYGSKEADFPSENPNTRIREDGLIWDKSIPGSERWTDPDTGERGDDVLGGAQAPARPAGDPRYVRNSELRARGYDTSDDPDIAILKRRGFREDQIARIKKAGTYKPGSFAGLEDLIGKDTWGQEVMGTKGGRFAGGMADAAFIGPTQTANSIPTSAKVFLPGAGPLAYAYDKLRGKNKFDKEFLDAQITVQRQLRDEAKPKDTMNLPLIGDPLEFGGNVATPFPFNKVQKGAGLLRSLGQRALGGATGAILQPEPGVEYNEKGESDYNRRKAMAALFGTTIGGGIGLAGKGLERLLSKKIPGPLVKDVSTLGTDIEAKLKAAVRADANTLTGLKGSASRGGDAGKLLEELDAAGDDLPRILQISAKIKRLTEQHANDKAFEEVTRGMRGVEAVGVPNTIHALDTTIAQLKKNQLPGNDAAIAFIKEFRDNLLPKKTMVKTGLLDEQGNDIMKEIVKKPDLTYEALAETRSSLKKKLRAIYNVDPTGGEAANGIDSSQYTRIAKALEEDLASAVDAQRPGMSALSRKARKQYADFKSKWSRDNINEGMVSTKTPDELLGKYVNTGPRSDRAGNAKAAMTQSGIESTKLQMLQAAEEASGGDASKANAILKKMQGASGVFFDGDDLARLEGLKKINKVAGASGKGLTSGAGALAGAPFGLAGAAVGATVGPRVPLFGHLPSEDISRIVKNLLLTKAGQKILLSANKYEPRSPEWERVILEGQAKLGQASGILGAKDRDRTKRRSLFEDNE